MTDFILLLLLTSCWTFGVRCLFQEGFLLERVGDWVWQRSEFLAKPLFQCPPCQSSIHGTYAYFALFNYKQLSNTDTVLLWIAFCVCLCGLNYLIMKTLLEKEPIDVTNHY